MPFSRWRIVTTQKQIAHISVEKIEPRCGIDTRRAAQGMATTSCCGKLLRDRGQKISCRFSLISALSAWPLALPHSRLKPPCGAGEDYCSLRCIGGPLPPLASLSGVKSGMSFLFGSGFCVSLILIGFPFGFVARPHSGFGPPCGAGERYWLAFWVPCTPFCGAR